MNTLSINKIIEFYIYRVTVVYCLIAFIMQIMMYRIVLCLEFDYNIYIGIYRSHFIDHRYQQIFGIEKLEQSIIYCFSVPNLYAKNKTKSCTDHFFFSKKFYLRLITAFYVVCIENIVLKFNYIVSNRIYLYKLLYVIK